MEIVFFIFLVFGLFIIFGLFIWMLIMQQQISELRDSVKHISTLVRKLSVTPVHQVMKSSDNADSVAGRTHRINEAVEAVPVREESPQIPPPAVQSVNRNSEVKEPVYTVNSQDYIKNSYRDDKTFDLQKALLGNIFSVVGAVAIIIATIIFIKIVSPYIVISPEVKIFLGFLAGLGMGIGALFMHRKENLKAYSEVLLGTGFAVLFITDYCAYSMFHLFNVWATAIVSVGFLVAAYIIADRMKTLSMLVIGLIGAYLTPLFAGGEASLVLSYFIFINMISLIFTLRNKKTNCINLINLILTLFVYTGYQISDSLNIVYPISLWVVYMVYDLLRDKTNKLDTVLSCINYAILTFFTSVIFKDAQAILAILLGAGAMIYGGLSVISRYLKGSLYKIYDYSVLINLWLVVYFSCNDVVSVMLWALIALLVSLVVRKSNADYLGGAVLWYYFMTFIGAILAKDGAEYCFAAQYTPVFNLRTFVFIVPAFMMLTSAIYILEDKYAKLRNSLLFSGLTLAYLYVIGEIGSIIGQYYAKDKALASFNEYMLYLITGFIYMLHTRRLADIFKSVLLQVISYIFAVIPFIALISLSYIYPDSVIPVFNLRFAAYVVAIVCYLILAKITKSDIPKYLAVILGFFLCHTEAVGINRIAEGVTYIISLCWVLYSGITTITGIIRSKKVLINSGIVFTILSIIRIFFYDLATVDALYKLIAFLALGIILMLISYIYTKNKKKN